MKILLISDKPDWAYATIANAIIRHNDCDDLLFSHIHCKGNQKVIRKKCKQFDYYFVLGWQNYRGLEFLEQKRTLVGIHSHQSFDGRKTTVEQDISPDDKVVEHLSGFRSINVVSKRLQRIFEQRGVSVIYTPNGVDSQKFCPATRPLSEFIVGSAGSLKNDWNKGVESFIRPACIRAGVELQTVRIGQHQIRHTEMPSFYQSLTCYVCASLSEGMSLSILEAASAGCIVLSTKCGDIEQLIVDGSTGYFIDRDVDSICSKLQKIKDDPVKSIEISCQIRQSIQREWDWQYRIRCWIDFVKSSVL